MSPTVLPPRRTPLTIGWEAVRANAVPAFVIQALMLATVTSYYLHPPFAELLNGVAEVKRAYGVVFVVTASVLAGSILPELLLVLLFQRGRVQMRNFRNVLFTAPVWAIAGVSVDLLYRGLAAALGDQATPAVVVAKICIDQFVYNVLFAAPYAVIAYEWKNRGFSFAAIRHCFTLEYYKDKIVPTLLTTWAVWIPLIAMIYSLPSALQFPLFSLALTLWVLLLTYMTNRFAAQSDRGATALPVDITPQTAR